MCDDGDDDDYSDNHGDDDDGAADDDGDTDYVDDYDDDDNGDGDAMAMVMMMVEGVSSLCWAFPAYREEIASLGLDEVLLQVKSERYFPMLKLCAKPSFCHVNPDTAEMMLF